LTFSATVSQKKRRNDRYYGLSQLSAVTGMHFREKNPLLSFKLARYLVVGVYYWSWVVLQSQLRTWNINESAISLLL